MNTKFIPPIAPPAIPEGLTFKVNVATHLEDFAITKSSRITWLHYHARITRVTAAQWYEGTPTRVDLATLARVCEVLGKDVDQVLILPDEE